MEKEKPCLLLYLVSIVVVTLYHFSGLALKYIQEKYRYSELKNLFNSQIYSVLEKDQKEYYILMRKVVLYNTYFKHLDLKRLIRCFSEVNHALLQREWENLEVAEKEVFLFYSTPYNLGIFMPIYFPIFLHTLKIIRSRRRRQRESSLKDGLHMNHQDLTENT